MLELTTCPGCQAELAAPPIAESTATELAAPRLECPLCGTHFAPQPAKLRRIPAAKVAKPSAPPLRPMPLRPTTPSESTPTIEAIEQPAVAADPIERETVLIPRQQSATVELPPLEVPVEPKPVAPERATVELEVAETVELPPVVKEVAKEPPALPKLSTPSSAEIKSPLTKLSDLLDTPQLRQFVAAAKTETLAPLSAKSQAATMPEVKVFTQAPAIAKTVEFSSAEGAAMLKRDFDFDLSTPDDSEGFNPFDSEPPEEPIANITALEDDPTELGWRLSRRLRNAAIVTMFTAAGLLGFLAFRPTSSAPTSPNTLARASESNLLDSASELLSPSDEPAPITDPAVEPAAFAAEEPAVPVKPIDDNPSLRGAPTYTTADLVAALEGATEARDHLQSHSLDDANEVAALGRNYARLCYLAQVYALLSDEAIADSLRERIQARDQFTLLFESSRARSEVSKIAGPWIAWKDKPHGGVFFCGALPDPIRHGELFEYPFELTSGQVLPVLLDEPIDAAQFGRAGSSVAAVIGVLVENPAERLPGYSGTAPQAVWCRELLPLREARLE